MRFYSFFLFCLASFSHLSLQSAVLLHAVDAEEKRQLEHEDYAVWNTLSGVKLSNDGRWVSFLIQPGKGHATLKIREIATDKEYSIARGSAPQFSFDSQHAIYVVKPDEELLEKLRKEKKPDENLPSPKLEILSLVDGTRTTVDRVGDFSLPTKAAGWLAFKIIENAELDKMTPSGSGLNETFEITPTGIQRPEKKRTYRQKPTQENPLTAETAESANREIQPQATLLQPPEERLPEAVAAKEGKKPVPKEKKHGTTLVLRNLRTHVELRFPFVDEYAFDELGTFLAFTTSAPNGEDDGLNVIDLKDLDVQQILSGRGHYGRLAFSKDGKQLAFLTDRDDYQSDTPAWSLYLWKNGRQKASLIVSRESEGVPQNWGLASKSAPRFSENGRHLHFSTQPRTPERDNDQQEPEPVAKLDVWHWQDPFLQPEQVLRADSERNRSYAAVYDLRSKKIFQLATEEIPEVKIDLGSKADFVLGTASEEYDKMRSWDVQSFSDWYLIDLTTGQKRLVAEKERGSPELSPTGKYIIWWDGSRRTWLTLPTKLSANQQHSPAPVDLGANLGYPLHDELHDEPALPSPYEPAGWLEDDEGVWICDRWDIWEVDPIGETAPVCITGGAGRKNGIRFRHVRLEHEQKYIDARQPQILSAFVHSTKASGYYRWYPADFAKDNHLESLILLDENVTELRKAQDADTVVFSRSTFARCPDLWSSDVDFKTTRQMSRINPQQSEYRWGTAELIHWTAEDGQPLDGLLFKPEGFDPEKKYPLLVYFYERYSDNLHSYYTPAAGRSIINFSFYVSRGYLVFIPDIPYEVGEPGPSAANAVLPGVKYLTREGFVDAERIGMQGHSWGGYQVAYLATVTDMFACAESGAPVSNMTSAYGGIRWGTGMSRMFQYEKTQSRIGSTLWEARDKYLANSPLFAADKINTPLLILHNDQDTAVPWYQGIELFVALRRLEKPAWMLNYNDEPHWVMTDENRMDFAKRMQQFFDHYLRGDPMPVWMAEGIPAVKKGKEFGFEYVQPEE